MLYQYQGHRRERYWFGFSYLPDLKHDRYLIKFKAALYSTFTGSKTCN